MEEQKPGTEVITILVTPTDEHQIKVEIQSRFKPEFLSTILHHLLEDLNGELNKGGSDDSNGNDA